MIIKNEIAVQEDVLREKMSTSEERDEDGIRLSLEK